MMKKVKSKDSNEMKDWDVSKMNKNKYETHKPRHKPREKQFSILMHEIWIKLKAFKKVLIFGGNLLNNEFLKLVKNASDQEGDNF